MHLFSYFHTGRRTNISFYCCQCPWWLLSHRSSLCQQRGLLLICGDSCFLSFCETTLMFPNTSKSSNSNSSPVPSVITSVLCPEGCSSILGIGFYSDWSVSLSFSTFFYVRLILFVTRFILTIFDHFMAVWGCFNSTKSTIHIVTRQSVSLPFVIQFRSFPSSK